MNIAFYRSHGRRASRFERRMRVAGIWLAIIFLTLAAVELAGVLRRDHATGWSSVVPAPPLR